MAYEKRLIRFARLKDRIYVSPVAPPPKKGSFDPAKLDQMVEPFIVRVERLRGSLRQPIELPEKPDGQPPGVGWTREDIQRLEFWLVKEWTGGGAYRFLVTDANGTQMEWESVWDPKMFPERPMPGSPVANWSPPPPVQQQVAPVGTVPGAQPMNGLSGQNGSGASSWISWPSGGQAGPGMMQPLQGAPYQQQPPPVMTMAPPPNWNNGWGFPMGPMGGMTPMGPGRRRSWDDDAPLQQPLPAPAAPVVAADPFKDSQIRALQDQLQKLEIERVKSEHAAQLEQARQQAQAQVDALRAEIRQASQQQAGPRESEEAVRLREERDRLQREREQLERDRTERAERERVDAQFRAMQEQMLKLVETMKSASAAPVGPDPALKALEETMRLQKEQFERERADTRAREAERDRREAEQRREFEHKEEMRRLQEQLAKQADETRRMIEQATVTKGPDPMIEYMRESSRQQADVMKEITRTQQAASDKVQAMMMSPQAILSMVKDSSNGTDHMLRNMSNFYNDMFQTIRQATDHIMQMNGGGSPSMVEQVVGRASEIADKFLDVKRDTAVAEAKVKQAQVVGQTELLKRQSEMMAATRGLGGAPGAPTPQSAPPPGVPRQAQPPRPVAVPPTVVVPPQPQAVAPATPVADAPASVPDNSGPGAKIIPLRKHGRTDDEWFGVALPDVQKLRVAVQLFLNGLAQEPPVIAENSVAPDGAVVAVLRAATIIEGHKISILAFDKLFKEGLYSDFADVLLPEATQPYRDEFARLLIETLSKKANPSVAGMDDAPSPVDTQPQT